MSLRAALQGLRLALALLVGGALGLAAYAHPVPTAEQIAWQTYAAVFGAAADGCGTPGKAPACPDAFCGVCCVVAGIGPQASGLPDRLHPLPLAVITTGDKQTVPPARTWRSQGPRGPPTVSLA